MRKAILAVIALMMISIGFATYSRQAAAAGAQQVGGDLQEKIRRLGSADPIERAAAACQIGAMGKQAAVAAMPNLLALLGDDTPVSGRLDC